MTRYQQVPTFGHDGIRKFHVNASLMKRTAVHDFEDLLQVRSSIIVISDLILTRI